MSITHVQITAVGTWQGDRQTYKTRQSTRKLQQILTCHSAVFLPQRKQLRKTETEGVQFRRCAAINTSYCCSPVPTPRRKSLTLGQYIS